jgi:glycosyltransferase involved in cell wall biosynthesis
MTPWLLVAGDFTPLGGMDAANHALAKYLASRGDEVHVVTHRAWPDLLDLPSIVAHRVWRPFDRHALGSPLLSRAGDRLWRKLRHRNVRVVGNGGNCHVPAANWIHYLHAAYAPHVSGPFPQRLKASLAHRRDLSAERTALDRARVVICNSRRTRQDVVERLGVPEARAHVVYYGSDPVRFAPVSDETRADARRRLALPPDRPAIGFVGALGDRRKAFDTVFAAFADLCDRRQWDADLVVVGTGVELPRWRGRAEARGLAGRIRFLGFRSDVPAVLAALDGLVHPARYEAYGLSVHEALCRGIPALVSASAGVAEQYPLELHGLLVRNPDDARELTDRLVFWRENLEVLRREVEPLSSALRRHTWDDMAAQIASLVERAA